MGSRLPGCFGIVYFEGPEHNVWRLGNVIAVLHLRVVLRGAVSKCIVLNVNKENTVRFGLYFERSFSAWFICCLGIFIF